MDWINSSDWNAQAPFEAPSGTIVLDAHVRGETQSVSVQSVPGNDGSALLVLFAAHNGETGAAVRLKDLLTAALEHHPALWQEVIEEHRAGHPSA